MFTESELSHDVEAEQLFQQFAIANHERQDKEFFILLNSPSLARPAHCGEDSAERNKPEARVHREDTVEKYISACCKHSLKLSITKDDVKLTGWRGIG